MISLFIDTSCKNVSISVVKDNEILSLITKDIPNMHSVYTTSFLKQALDDAKIKPHEVDNIYVVNGPGSFTGLRIGVTIAKTYGFLIDKYVTPVSSLKAIALSTNYQGIIMSIIPANKTHYYIGIYNELYEPIHEEQFVSLDTVNELITKYHPYLVGVDELNILDNQINIISLDILKIINYYQNEEKINYHKLVPNYLKLPQAIEDKKVKE